MASQSLTDLTPTLEKKARAFLVLCYERTLQVHVTCTARTIHEQEALYAQGREPLEKVNALRAAVGLWKIKEDANKRPVTWTLKSKHIVYSKSKNLADHKARAFDVALVKGKQFVWELKVDVNDNDINDWEEIGTLGESCGLVWGGRFKNAKGEPRPDRPHLEDKV